MLSVIVSKMNQLAVTHAGRAILGAVAEGAIVETLAPVS